MGKDNKIELKKELLEVMSLRNKVLAIKRNLENIFNNRGLAEKEEDLKYLKNDLERLE